MQYSPAIPFVGALKQRQAPNDLKPGEEFVRLTMYTGEHDPVRPGPGPRIRGGLTTGAPHFTEPARRFRL